MKAITFAEFGPPEVLHVTDVTAPMPKDGEVLVRVHATSVTYGDLAARNFKNVSGREFNMPWPLLFLSRLHFGLRTPKVHILGSEFSGEVASVGKHVTRFKSGDEVFGFLGQHMGAYAEYVCVPKGGALAIKPTNLSHEQAACVPYGAIMASSLLRHARIEYGHKVLINGASGSIGSAALQLAKVYGAQVTGVCDAARFEYVKALGADEMIDHAKEDFTQNGKTYDLIFDVLGKSSFFKCRNSLTATGIYFPVSFKTKALVQLLWTKVTRSHKKVICTLASESPEDLVVVRQLIEEGKYKSIVDRAYPTELAAQAHAYAQSGAKKGCIAISFFPAARQTPVELAGAVLAASDMRNGHPEVSRQP
jgi:NADPH:quinone reductase-like Zn-dependent oxidoreductase